MKSTLRRAAVRSSVRTLLACFVSIGLTNAAALADAPSDAAETKPNVLFIITDDMNTALGCYGHPLVKSPNIDRLAARGVRFDRAYCQAPVCNPTRASIFSGLLPETVGVLDNKTAWPDRFANSQYMPHFFQTRGYFTATIGKVLDHKRVPNQPYWDLELREWGKFPCESQIVKQGRLSVRSSSFWAMLRGPDEETGDGDVAQRAARVLQKWTREQPQQMPFFMAVGFRRPHSPYAAPSRYFDMYPLKSIVLPHSPPEHLKSILPAAKNGREPGPGNWKPTLRGYYACVSFVDAQVGKLLDTLDRLDLWKTTIVVFVSDHGYHTGHHGMWHKDTLFEWSARVPLIIAAPGKRRGAVCRRVVEILDLYPTLAALCGLDIPEALEGVSLQPLLGDPNRHWKRAALTVVGRIDQEGKRTLVGHSIRTERFRYTQWAGGRRGVELYDHASDPDEFINLAEQPARAQTVSKLRDLLQARRQAAR